MERFSLAETFETMYEFYKTRYKIVKLKKETHKNAVRS